MTDAVPGPTKATVSARLKAFKERHPRALALAFFAAGFVFDAVMVNRIDETPILIQQAGYLVVVGILLAVGLRMEHRKLEAPRLLRPVWKYSEHLMHFLLGTLLNAYMLFYFKSASGLTAVLFVIVIGVLLAINEMPQFHKFGPVVLIGLYSYSLTSYFAYLIPVLLGYLRPWMFFAGVLMSFLPLSLLGLGIHRWGGTRKALFVHAIAPAIGVQALLLVLFTQRLIPPVPLAVRTLGIYHDVVRDPSGGYALTRQARNWKMWIHDDREFLARPNDRIFAFVRIFAPRNFRDRVMVRWQFLDPTVGWLPSGAVPIAVTGGREEGFRGYSYKSHFQPGTWRVSIETEDGREIGGLRFSVAQDTGDRPRETIVEHE